MKAVLLCVLLLPLAAACGAEGTSKAVEPEKAPAIDGKVGLPEVKVAVPQRQPIEGIVEAPGTFYPDEEVTISSEATGVVTEVTVDEGSRVVRGEALVRIDETKARIAVRQAEASLAQARANFEQTNGERARKQILLADRTISAAAFATFKAQHDAAAAAVDAAEATLALARERLADLTVLAPFAGLIRERTVAPGAYVRDGDRLLVLMRVDPLKLVFDLPEKHAARVSSGAEVRARTAPFPGETFRGRVRVVLPVVAQESRAVRVEAQVANPSFRLKPGFYASVEVPLRSLSGSLTVPRGALASREGTENVWIVRNDTVELARVETGVVGSAAIEIASGLDEDDEVVISGGETLQPGDRVIAKPLNGDQGPGVGGQKAGSGAGR